MQRTPAGWAEQEFRSGEVVSLSAPEVRLEVDAVYAGITLDPA